MHISSQAMSVIHCRFSKCQWSGGEQAVFEHLEDYHRKFLREPNGKTYFVLNCTDLRQKVFVLCTPQGLYWMCRSKRYSPKNSYRFGVFHLGNSIPVSFTLQLSMRHNKYWKYWGPFKSQTENYAYRFQENYEVDLKYDLMTKWSDNLISKRLRLVFDELDNIWPCTAYLMYKERYKRLYRLCFQSFTCAVCWELICRDARFCENTHFVCLNCFKEMRIRAQGKGPSEKIGSESRKALVCPICRGQYLYDCRDDELESLLRVVKWPDSVKSSRPSESPEPMSGRKNDNSY